MAVAEEIMALTAQSKPNTQPVESAPTTMRVRKRNGNLEPVDVNKIVRAVGRCCARLQHVDSIRVATKTIGGLYDGATTRELDRLSINTAASLIVEEPEYSRLAARLLATYIDKEVRNQEIQSFSQSISAGHQTGLISTQVAEFVAANSRKLNDAVEPERNDLFEYFGLRTVYDRYLLRHPTRRDVLETPQYFFLRVACGIAQNAGEAIALYRLFSSLEYMPSTPTLFNSATNSQQLSSCFLLDSPQDELEAIYRKYTDVALLSKFAGGIGIAYHRVRSNGSHIRGTNGHSNGIIPWLKTLDSSVAAVNQGGKRRGACCVYLESWHADIEAFLELRENTGDEAQRTHNLNLANWAPDLFMQRVEADGLWSLFDPKAAPHLPDLYGEEFEQAYLAAEAQGVFAKQIRARDLYQRMMKTLAQTGNGWMTFKDASNRKCNQTARSGTAVHLSNLCTEIIEVTSAEETAVCNLGSLNLSRYVDEGGFDFEKLARNVRLAMRALDRVIDINFYPIPAAASSNRRWRPVGLGLMGLQDVFFQLKLPFDSPEALRLSTRIQEEIYYRALLASCELAEELVDYFSEFEVIVSYLYDPDEIFKVNVGRCTSGQFIAGRHRPDEKAKLHATAVYLKPLERLAIFDADPVPRLSFESGRQAGHGGPSVNRIALHPGSGSERKNWPEANWAELLQYLVHSTELNLLLVGGEAEGERLQRLAAALPPARAGVAHSLPLAELAARLQGCSGFIGHDSGISHLAAAVGLDALVLWGDTSSEEIWRPMGDKVTVLRAEEGLGNLSVQRVVEAMQNPKLQAPSSREAPSPKLQAPNGTLNTQGGPLGCV